MVVRQLPEGVLAIAAECRQRGWRNGRRALGPQGAGRVDRASRIDATARRRAGSYRLGGKLGHGALRKAGESGEAAQPVSRRQRFRLGAELPRLPQRRLTMGIVVFQPAGRRTPQALIQWSDRLVAKGWNGLEVYSNWELSQLAKISEPGAPAAIPAHAVNTFG